MKRVLTLLILLMTAFSGISARKAEPYGSYRPYTRWWWFADNIRKTDVRDQLIWAKEAGLGGVEIAWINARQKLPDLGTPQPWLSEEWGEIVAYAKTCADSLGLGCDFTYGTLWPFMDHEMPEKYGTRTYFDQKSPKTRGGSWFMPERGRVLDHLSKEAFDWYADRMDSGLKKAYKGSTSAIFVDSWEVKSKHLWTAELGNIFFERFGYRIEPVMEKLYEPGYEDYYYDYLEVVSDLAIDNFYKPFTERAHMNGAISRSQCNGSPTDLLSAYLVVDIPETEALLYEPNFSRIAASAATLGNKPVVSAETFTCLYGFGKKPLKNGRGPEMGREQIADMRLVADALFANGTNQIVWHGMPYNKVGSKDKHFYASVHLAPTAYFADQIRDFNAYMTRVSEYMRKGRNYSEVAVYLPVEDGHRKLYYPSKLRYPGMNHQYQLSYVRAPECLDGYQPTWVNRQILTEGKMKKGRLTFGECSFKAFVADVEYMDIASLQALVGHARKGLPVVMVRTPKQPGVNRSDEYAKLLEQLKNLPNVTSDPSSVLKHISPVMAGEDLPEFWCREVKGDRYIFIANPAACDMHYHLRYGQAFEDKGSVRKVSVYTRKGAKPYTLNFKPNQSILLKVSANGRIEEIDLNFSAKRIEGPGVFE